MKYKVQGPRLLVQVKKFKLEDVEKMEGSIFYKANVVLEDAVSETTHQSAGEVLQLGSTAYKRKDSGCDGTPWCKIGDKIHFSRYGAQRIGVKEATDFEFWILNDKDVLAIEEDIRDVE